MGCTFCLPDIRVGLEMLGVELHRDSGAPRGRGICARVEGAAVTTPGQVLGMTHSLPGEAPGSQSQHVRV